MHNVGWRKKNFKDMDHLVEGQIWDRFRSIMDRTIIMVGGDGGESDVNSKRF